MKIWSIILTVHRSHVKINILKLIKRWPTTNIDNVDTASIDGMQTIWKF